MSDTVTIDGLEYSVEEIKQRVEPVKTPRPGEVWVYDGTPYAICQKIYGNDERAALCFEAGPCLTVDETFLRRGIYLAPSVEEYYRAKLEAEYRRGLENGARAQYESTSGKLSDLEGLELLEAKAEAFDAIRDEGKVASRLDAFYKVRELEKSKGYEHPWNIRQFYERLSRMP